MPIKGEFLNLVIAAWQPFYPRQNLTPLDAQEMVETAGAVFDLLDEWDRRSKQDANDEEVENK